MASSVRSGAGAVHALGNCSLVVLRWSCGNHNPVGIPNPGPWCDFQNAEPLKYYTGFVIEMLGPPLLAAMGSLGVGWIIAGFRAGI
jgi:hypothetical protein